MAGNFAGDDLVENGWRHGIGHGMILPPNYRVAAKLAFTMLDLNALSLPDLFAELTGSGCLRDLIDSMAHEDLGRAGDITSDSIIDAQAHGPGAIVARQMGVVAGLG